LGIQSVEISRQNHIAKRCHRGRSYSTGEEPRSCTGQAGCPVNVQDRLGTQFMYRRGWVPRSCLRKGSQCPGHVLVRVAQAMFWKGCLMPRSHSRKGCPGHIQERVAQVIFSTKGCPMPSSYSRKRSCPRMGCTGHVLERVAQVMF
jgi:hypothetical protein